MSRLAGSQFGQCPCGGNYAVTQRDIEFGVGEETTSVNGVLRGACPECNSMVYKAGALTDLEAMWRGAPAVRVLPGP